MLRRSVTSLGVLGLVAALAPAAPAAADHEASFDRKSDNIQLVEHLQFPQGTDMFFQRRDGRQTVDGRTVVDQRDYLFAGADASAAVGDPPEGTPEGFRVYDVTDPTAPVELVAVDCPGYHADLALHEELLVHGIDSAGTNEGCAERFDPNGLNQEGEAGVRVFDVSDPASPTLLAHLTEEQTETDAHNITTLPWAGLLYIAGSGFTQSNPVLTIVDLEDPSFPAKVIPMRDISPNALAECHDIGVAEMEHRDLAFCAAVEQTFVWDITDPWNPKHVSTVLGPPETIHHGARLAPDGKTLVLNDELGGAAVAPGCAPTTRDPLGGIFFYDITVPELPVYLGVFSTSEAAGKMPCTSHFFNFIPGTTLLTIGWYKAGMLVVDYANRTAPTEHAVFTPTGGDFWASYYWHGYVYGNSFGGGGLYGGTDESGGVWITQVDGVGDVEPSHFDMGTSWAPWTAPDDDQPGLGFGREKGHGEGHGKQPPEGLFGR